jgi:hypothetical protein
MTAQMRMVVSIFVDHAPAAGVEEAAMREERQPARHTNLKLCS